MAVANTKSTVITNADASPRTPNSSYLEHGKIRECVATVEVAAADDDTSVYRMVRIPSGARISQILVANDAITAGTSYDLGVYKNAGDGGAVVNVDQFLSAVDMSSARAQFTDLTHESADFDIDKVEKRIWEMTGIALTADPFLEYDIAFTANTVGTAAGTISLIVRYVL